MFAIDVTQNADFSYVQLNEQLKALLEEERTPLANLAQFAAFVFQTVPHLNWAGFYLLDGKELVLGPFQGKVACFRIPMNRGVCGAAASARKPVLVPNVHEFPGHIACDSASQSELVIPLLFEGSLLGVLDLDSPLSGRFTEEDQHGLELLFTTLIRASDWSMPWGPSFS